MPDAMEGTDWALLLGATVGLLALVGLGEWLRASGRAPAEASRRVVHASVGLFVVAAPWLFAGPAPLYLLAAAFAGLNVLALRRGWFPGMHAIDRASVGTVTFPLALLVALAVAWTPDPGRVFALQAAFLVMGLADPLASLAGSRVRNPRPYRLGGAAKSVAGSAAFFAAALVLSFVFLAWLQLGGRLAWTPAEVVLAAFTVAAVTTAVEALGEGGWDNFFIVVAVLVVLIPFDEQPALRAQWLVAVPLGLVFGGLAFALRFLSASGAVAGGLLAVSVVGLGGPAWYVPAFAFFFLSSLLSVAGRRRKAGAERRSEKGSVRDAGQVFANGGVGWALLLVHAVAPHEVFYWGFMGAFAAAAADTWATEVGLFSRRRPRMILTGLHVPRGTSGAVSGVGTLGALLGAAVVWASAWPFEAVGGRPAPAAAVVLAGFAASFVDSLVGATIQARYRDAATGEETERAGGGTHALVRGRPWMTNDRVNLLCTLTGALLAMACFPAWAFAS